MYRQGDVLLIPSPRTAATTEALPRVGERLVLLEGNATGHAHAIAEPFATLHALSGTADLLLVVAGTAPARLRHEEHATVDIPPGRYLVRRQREYLPGIHDAAPPRFFAD